MAGDLKQPPLGVSPRKIEAEHRLAKIKIAMSEYMVQNLEISLEWISEYNELIDYLRHEKDNFKPTYTLRSIYTGSDKS